MPPEDSSTSNEASTENLNSVDEIANLLTEGLDDSTESEDNLEESTSDQSEESEELEDENENEEDEDGADESESDEEEEENENDEEETWSSALGVGDEVIVVDDEGNFSGIKTKVEGVSETVPLKDLIHGYQSNKSNTVKSQSLAEERKILEGQKTELTTTYAKKLDDLDTLTEYLNKKVTADYDGIDWNKLRFDDPAEYAAMKQDYAAKAQEMQNLQSIINSEKDTQNQEQQGEMYEARKAHIHQQFGKMLENNPEWEDKEKYKEAMSEMKTFLTDSYGYSDQDFNTVNDARMFELVKDAMAFRKGKIVAKKKLKKKVPKFQKVGTNKTRKKAKVSRLDTLTKKAASSTGASRRGAQMDAVAELLIGDTK